MFVRFFSLSLLALYALHLSACSSSPPSLMLVIDAEPGVRARTTRVELDVRGADNIMVFGQSYDLSMRGLPIRKSFVPRGGDLSRFIVATVSAYEAGSSAPLLVSRIRSGFANGQNEVRVLLLDGCIGQPCSDGSTCVVESGSPRCVPTPEVIPTLDAGLLDGSVALDTTTTDASCTPACNGRTCSVDPVCGTSCGTCETGQQCSSEGRCQTVSPNAPRFIDAPSVVDRQPIFGGRDFMVSATVTDPQGVGTIVAAEVRNPAGQPGGPGRYAVLNATAGSGLFTATVTWAQLSTQGSLSDVSGSTRRTLQFRFVDEDGNELVREISVQLGGCPEALCGGACADCPSNATNVACVSILCVATACENGYAACGSRCVACPSGAVQTMCTGNSECVATACTSGQHVCGQRCVSNASVNTCGDRCTTCPPVTGAMASCDGTACQYTCTAGNQRYCGNDCRVCPTGELVASTTCSDSGQCVIASCVAGYRLCAGVCVPEAYYLDRDGDGFGADSSRTLACAPANIAVVYRAGDCNDARSSVFPGQTAYFRTALDGSWDYNCDGRNEVRTSGMNCGPEGGQCVRNGSTATCRLPNRSGDCVAELTSPNCGDTTDGYECLSAANQQCNRIDYVWHYDCR